MEKISQDDVFLILKLIDQSKFDEMHLEIGDIKLDLKKHGSGVITEDLKCRPESNEKPSVAEPCVEKAREIEDVLDTAGVLPEENGLIPIKAPMLGTFYRAPKPGAPPFVEVGQDITTGDTVCIIEVMKLFNTVKAGVSGRIAKICAKDGQMVEFQQVLFLLHDTENLEETQRACAG